MYIGISTRRTGFRANTESSKLKIIEAKTF